MEDMTFSELVNRRFRYLMDEYGFSVIHEEYYPRDFGNSLIVLQSKECRIRILKEKGEVFIDAGPLWAPVDWASNAANLWFDLSLVTQFLTRGADKWTYDHFDSLVGQSSVDAQLARLADALRPYWDRVCTFFRKESFEIRGAELEEFRNQRLKDLRDALMSKEKHS